LTRIVLAFAAGIVVGAALVSALWIRAIDRKEYP
jgi:hypothetical protein